MKIGHRAALPYKAPKPVGESGDAYDAAYDPGAHTVTEVLAYVADHPDQAAEIRAAEEAGKARVTLLEALAQDDPET